MECKACEAIKEFIWEERGNNGGVDTEWNSGFNDGWDSAMTEIFRIIQQDHICKGEDQCQK